MNIWAEKNIKTLQLLNLCSFRVTSICEPTPLTKFHYPQLTTVNFIKVMHYYFHSSTTLQQNSSDKQAERDFGTAERRSKIPEM